jgi:hypothetical protein
MASDATLSSSNCGIIIRLEFRMTELHPKQAENHEQTHPSRNRIGVKAGILFKRVRGGITNVFAKEKIQLHYDRDETIELVKNSGFSFSKYDINSLTWSPDAMTQLVSTDNENLSRFLYRLSNFTGKLNKETSTKVLEILKITLPKMERCDLL